MATTTASPSPQKKKLLSSPTTASFLSFFRTSSKASPDSEQQQQQQEQEQQEQQEQEQQPHQSRTHSFSFKKLLRYLRIVILILAFATLILDAITLSFEVNVMGLDLSDVATQAGLLLAPDILAMVMILVLLIYPFMVRISQPVPYIEEPYDYSDDEYYEDDNEEEQSVRAESIRHGNNHDREEMGEEEILEAVRATRRRIQQELALQQDPSSRSRRSRRHHQEQQQEQEQEQERLSATLSPVLGGHMETNVQVEQEDEKVNAAATAETTAITVGEERAPSISPSTLKRRQRKRQNIYLALRLICSFGLAALALYWPASNLKPPMGYLPGMDTYRHRRPPPPTTTGDLTGNGTFTGNGGNWGRNGTQTWNNGTSPTGRSWGGRNGSGNNGVDNGSDGRPGSGGGHHGGYGSRWCQLEEAFGDNQSAIVYCQIKTIRPAMTYVWAILIIVELCIAFMAGDFSTAKASDGAEQPLEMSEHQEQEEILEDTGVDGHAQHSSRPDPIPYMDDEASAGGMGEPTPVKPSTRRQRSARIRPSSSDQQG